MVKVNGYIYQAQDALCCIDKRTNLTINSEKVGNFSCNDGLLLILSPDFKQRLYWTPFSSYNGAKKSKVVDIKVNNDRVVFLLLTQGGMITKNSFQGTKPPINDTIYVGYVAIFPTVKNQ